MVLTSGRAGIVAPSRHIGKSLAVAPQFPSASTLPIQPLAQRELSFATRKVVFWNTVTSRNVLEPRSAVGTDTAEGEYSDELHPPHFRTELAAVTTVENGEESEAAAESAVVPPMAIDRGVELKASEFGSAASCPYAFPPHPNSVPSVATARACEDDVETREICLPPGRLIVTGVGRSVVVPSPRRPPPFEPHAIADPPDTTANEVLQPLAIDVAPETPGTFVGVLKDICQFP